jgi:thiamine kinase-like enzyme
LKKILTLYQVTFKKKFPNYLFVSPLSLQNKKQILYIPNEGYFRIFPFVKSSKNYTVVHSPKQAFEAAAQFGLFTKNLENFDVATLNTIIPHFHNLNLRYQQFEQSLINGNVRRVDECKTEINFLLQQKEIVSKYNTLIANPNFKLRVTHHDTKISNVLFDDKDNGLCVIDLDTVMPGYFISDVGDMMRTYICPVSEEEIDTNKIIIRKDYYNAIEDGYLSKMDLILTNEEKDNFHFSGEFMIYMQALRFLTDYINDDVYYGAKYDKHNYNRAKNQIVLLCKYTCLLKN